MNRRAFVKALLGTAAAAVVFDRFPLELGGAPRWAVAGTTLKRGDIFSIEGVRSINPLTYRDSGYLQLFTVTADVGAGEEIPECVIYPQIIESGPYQNVSALPADDAALIVYGGTP